MFRPSKKTSPACRNPGVRSCIRLMHRMKVLFPHPEGPITDVTAFRPMSIVMSRRTWWSPNQALNALTSIALSVAVSIASSILLLSLPREKPSAHAQDQHHEDQHDGARPCLVVPVLVRRDRVGEHLERDRGDRLVEPRLPELVPQGGEQERRRLPDDPRHGEEDPRHDPGQGGPHGDEERRLPPRDPQ